MAVSDGRGEGEPRMERSAGRRQQLPAASEVDAVVGVAPVGRASPHRHQLACPQAGEVVRDEALRLAERLRELADLPVAAGEFAEQLPAQRVSSELQEARGRCPGAAVRCHSEIIHQMKSIEQGFLFENFGVPYAGRLRVVSIGLLREGHLHASLKALYLEPGDESEVPVDGYIVDIHRGALIIEVQTGNFSAIARKIRSLVERHQVRLVFPVPRDRWIVKMPQRAGDAVTRRKSPKHQGVVDVFSELVSFPELISHQNFEVDVVLTEEESVWRFDSPRRWRRRGWVMVERRLLRVYETVSLRSLHDYLSVMPIGLPVEFVTSDLAHGLGRPRPLAQKVAYCLKRSGLIEKVGSQGNAIVYAKVRAAALLPVVEDPNVLKVAKR